MAFDHLALGAARLGFAGRHLLVDRLEFGDGEADALLRRQQLFLVFLQLVLEAGERGRVGLLGGHFLVHPGRVGFVAGEGLDEMLARHAGTVHAQVHDLALETADFLDRVADGVAQRLDLLDRETDAHEQIGHGILGGQVLLAVGAVLGALGLHFLVQFV